MGDFNGLDVHLGNLARLSSARTYSISAENPDGAKAGGARSIDGPHAHGARDLGPGWKISPFVPLPAGSITTLAEIEGPGAIGRHGVPACAVAAQQPAAVRRAAHAARRRSGTGAVRRDLRGLGLQQHRVVG
jgi:hypothetical protein